MIVVTVQVTVINTRYDYETVHCSGTELLLCVLALFGKIDALWGG